MKARRMSAFALVVAACALLAASVGATSAPAGPAVAQSSQQADVQTSGTTTQVGTMTVQLQIRRFVKRGNRLYAVGTAIGRFNPSDANAQAYATGMSRRAFVVPVRKLKRLASAQRICPILDLTLGPLDLNLLGLIVHLDRVRLTITADSEGGLLGSLLCGLSGPAPLAQQAAKLTRAARRSGLATKGISIAAPLVQQPSSGGGSGGGSSLMTTSGAVSPMVLCNVLTLVLGPLHLNLLGLIVHLSGAAPTDPVVLVIVADSEGGLLGRLLCPGIAAPPPPPPAPAG
jgi:hypothetical protein